MHHKIINRASWFLLPIIIIGCEKLPTGPVNFVMSGYVHESDSDPAIPVKDAKVLVGDVYDISDSTGYFIIDNILGRRGEENTYHFTITHLMYDTLIETVMIKSNKEKDFYLVKKEDFFPLTEGNYWKFDYQFKADHSSPTKTKYVGQMKWEVIESNNDWQNRRMSYKIQETFTGFYYYYEGSLSNWDSTYTDTTYFEGRTREVFNVFQDRQNQLEFTRIVWVDSHWLNFDIDRYQSPTMGDTLHIQIDRNWEFQYADFVKNIGLVYFKWHGGSYHITGDETAKLIEYHIV